MFRGRRNQNRRQPQRSRSGPSRSAASLPNKKELTALVPFQIRRNKQLISISSHGEGLTVTRKIRIQTTLTAAGVSNIVFSDVFARFVLELAITIPASSNATFTPREILVQALGVTGTAGVNTLTVRIYDNPVQSGSGVFANTPYFEAQDSYIQAGIGHVHAIFPKAATYSIGSNDGGGLLGLPLVSATTSTGCTLIFDITGTFTIKQLVGVQITDSFERLSLSDETDLQTAEYAV
jgi:hypothetical protein